MRRTAARRPRLGVYTRQRLWGLTFVLPALLFFIIFDFYPMLRAFYLSLTDYNLLASPQFVGLENYATLLADKRFVRAVSNTAGYMLGTTMPLWVLSLGAALLFNRRFRGRGFFQLLYFTPVVLSGVPVAMVWRVLFHPKGLINAALSPFIAEPLPWLTSAALAPLALIIMTIWQEVGFYFIIFLAGLQDIPEELYEAARIDGASNWQAFWRITLPLLKPTSLFVMIISFIHAFQSFGNQYVLTRGGPSDATNVIALHIYSTSFTSLRLGYAAAMSLVMFAVIIAFTLVQMRLVRAEEVGYV
ncbi:MAG: sugar ABC transporter permease [Anaerolineae bacterium]|nr:sugar ABC transporter permease [Anaerolineae bacterium]GIK37165.1 MAG: binding-protein-dependent transport system inner membrane protein [Chloroflexota bacterium]